MLMTSTKFCHVWYKNYYDGGKQQRLSDTKQSMSPPKVTASRLQTQSSLCNICRVLCGAVNQKGAQGEAASRNNQRQRAAAKKAG